MLEINKKNFAKYPRYFVKDNCSAGWADTAYLLVQKPGDESIRVLKGGKWFVPRSWSEAYCDRMADYGVWKEITEEEAVFYV